MNKQLVITSIATLMLLAGAVQQAAAAGFLQIEGIPGEATDDGHKDWINLLSVSFAIDSSSSPTGGGGAGKATFSDIVVVKEVDASTPKLQESIVKGEHLRSVKIDFTKTFQGGKEVPYLQWELKNVRISSYSFGGTSSGDTVPTEQISLNFEEIKVTYTRLDAKGQSQGNVEFEWKVEEGES